MPTISGKAWPEKINSLPTYSPYDRKTAMKKVTPLVFVAELFSFLIWAIELLVKLAILAGLFLVDLVSQFKRQSMQRMFWGRSGFYGLTFQSLVIFFGIALGVTVVFGLSSITPVEAELEEEYLYAVAPNDVIVESSSLETLIPDSSSRYEGVERYKVKPGDTLSSVAEKFEISIDTVRWANDLKDVNYLKVGQTLKILPASGVLHKVKKGDSLASVSKKYKAAKQAVADVNWLDPPYKLKAGTQLFIPEGTMPPPKQTTASKVRYVRPSSYAPVSSAGAFLSWPTPGLSPYGNVSQCPSYYHMAIDVWGPLNSPIVAAAPGKVVFAGWHNSGYARTVVIDHQNGYSTLYAHMNYTSVRSGQYVGRGQKIGGMGATGWATGVHVHFELRKGHGFASSLVNPAYSLQVGNRCR